MHLPLQIFSYLYLKLMSNDTLFTFSCTMKLQLSVQTVSGCVINLPRVFCCCSRLSHCRYGVALAFRWKVDGNQMVRF